MPWCDRAISIFLSLSVTLSVMGLEGCNKNNKDKEQAQAPAGQAQPDEHAPATQYATPTADQLYQLVAPVALFPDQLLAQVLAASTYPDQVSTAYTWLQQNASLKGTALAEAVNQQPWDASVKGLTQFSDVLTQMATNLSWTSALGDAYFNVPQSVMNAVQVMRQRAYQAGNLKSNPQQNVKVENQAPGDGSSRHRLLRASSRSRWCSLRRRPSLFSRHSRKWCTSQPTIRRWCMARPCRLPPGYSTGAMVATSIISFGVGIAVGAAMSDSCCGWGYNSWGCGWNNSSVTYNRNVYVSNSNTFVNRNNYYNRNNINTNNINTNNINRNNVNANNVNRNNLNANNINRNNANNRVNNLDSNPRNGNFSEPKFNQKYDQQQYRNQGAQNQINQAERGAGNRQGANQQGEAGNLQGQNRAGNMQQQNGAGNMQAQSRPGNANQPQRDQARGYGQQAQADRGTNTGAFNGYSAGGNTRTNSARGQQSLEARNNGGPRQQPAAAAGGWQSDAGARQGGGGGGRAEGRKR